MRSGPGLDIGGTVVWRMWALVAGSSGRLVGEGAFALGLVRGRCRGPRRGAGHIRTKHRDAAVEIPVGRIQGGANTQGWGHHMGDWRGLLVFRCDRSLGLVWFWPTPCLFLSAFETVEMFNKSPDVCLYNQSVV